MKAISTSSFLKHLSNGLNCCIYHFNQDQTVFKAAGKTLKINENFYTLTRSKRKRFLERLHPVIEMENKTINNRSIDIQVIYTPVESNHHQEGLIWLFLSASQHLDENFIAMLRTFSEIFGLLTNVKQMEESNALYRQTTAFIGNFMPNGLMLYDKNDALLYCNDTAEKMNIQHIHSDQLSNNEVLDISTNDFYYGNQLIGKINYSTSQNGLDSHYDRKNTIKSFNKIIGKHPKLNNVLSIVNQVALTDGTVLIRGESGTGKEEYAKLIHNLSDRRNRLFVALNCAAIPENLLESELFGYEAGSFTGAKKEGKTGKFEVANGGTLFLDEIGDMPLSIQVKLLRVLQERYIEPIGSNKTIPIDVRIICATHHDLENKMVKGDFREDLFYRINVIPISIPSLKNRSDDIELLLNYYVKKYCILQKKGFMTLSHDAMNALTHYHWQGNIRELINVVEYGVTMSNKSIIDLSDLPSYINTNKNSLIEFQPEIKDQSAVKPSKEELFRLMDDFGNNTEGKKQLAKHLNISLATLYRMIAKYKKVR